MNATVADYYRSYDIEDKHRKRVSKYRKETIKLELKECRKWISDIYRIKSTWYSVCYSGFMKYLYDKDKRKVKDFKSGEYIKNRLSRIISKNRCYMRKMIKLDKVPIYKSEDVFEFLLILDEAVKRNRLNEFIDIPDVFYILRQIKAVGIEYYI